MTRDQPNREKGQKDSRPKIFFINRVLGDWKEDVIYGHDLAAASIGIIGMGGVGKVPYTVMTCKSWCWHMKAKEPFVCIELTTLFALLLFYLHISFDYYVLLLFRQSQSVPVLAECWSTTTIGPASTFAVSE
jgi:hypothetical protein